MNIIQADAQELPFVDERFDVSVMCEVLEHLACKDNCLREFTRVTKHDGWGVVTLPNFLHPRQFLAAFRHIQPIETPVTAYSIKKLICQQRGWRIHDVASALGYTNSCRCVPLLGLHSAFLLRRV